MRIRNLFFGIILSLFSLGGALAQNEGLEELIEPQQSEQSEQPEQPEQPEQAQRQPEVERFEDWGVRCGTVKETGEKACEMFQAVTQTDTGEQVMAVVVGYPPQLDQPAAVFQLPLGMHLPPGVELSIDGGESIRFPVQVCFPQGCRADLLLEALLLQRLRAGTKAIVTIRGPQGQQVELPLSLQGFTAALERVTP